ncbi:MAG: hypothetical protein ACYCXG_05755 [Acidiferrobacter sp.]
MDIWEDPAVQDRIWDYLEHRQLLASFTTLGGIAVREGAHCSFSHAEPVGADTLLLCHFDFEERLPFGGAPEQRLRQQGQVHLRLSPQGQVLDAWLSRPHTV